MEIVECGTDQTVCLSGTFRTTYSTKLSNTWLQERQLSSSMNTMAAGIVVFCFFSSILSTVASLKCQTCLVSGNECKEEDVKMVECKDNEEFCFSIIANTTLTNVSMTLMIKGCLKPEECHEGFYSTTTINDRYELANMHCCQTDGCNSEPLLLPNYEELQPNGLQCPGCYVQDADSCEGHQPVICLSTEDQCLKVTSSIQAFGNYTDKYSFQGCTTKKSCAYSTGEFQLVDGMFNFNVSTLECRNASYHYPDLK
ncbi:phospholipase A2 inhibitor and Ly6/PLAUR domain-containing protein-like [Candoia aspera]|uniref:phospholipase A2 inhibitor and Ly6/PLAUR domain-containing protein-like n=1 Tax=Candoia aspera TaxID=51853 RepID=UPI002FD825CA